MTTPMPLTVIDDFKGVPRLRRFAAALEGVVALAALAGGVSLAWAPDGSLLGASPRLLEGSGFHDYRVPGVLLAAVIGGGNALAAVLTLRKSAYASLLSLLAGGALVVFIVTETLVLRERSVLQPICFGFGLAIALSSLPRRENPARVNGAPPPRS